VSPPAGPWRARTPAPPTLAPRQCHQCQGELMGRGDDGKGSRWIAEATCSTDRGREFLGAGGGGTIARWEQHTAEAWRDERW
jgi:hypothetical protein